MFGGAVRAEEFAGEVNDGFAAPDHPHPAGRGDPGHGGSLQVFGRGKLEEARDLLLVEDDGHPFLRFTDRQLGAVESLILLGDSVEVDIEAVGQLADRHRYTARAEVIAALDHPRGLRVTEQPLELAFLGGVALLHLGSAFGEAFGRVRFRGTGCAAAAVPSGLAAEQHDDIPQLGRSPHDIFSGGRGDDRADLHPLGDISGVVDLTHQPGREADLVAVGGIARRRTGDDLALGQLAGDGFGNGLERIGRAGDPHRLIDIAAPGKRVADCATQTGGGPAERLDFGRMVVCLVLEHQKPLLVSAADIDGDLHRAGVDLLRLVKVGQHAALFQHLGADGGEVHQSDGTRGASHLGAQLEVALIGLPHRRRFDLHVVKLGRKGGVAAVVGPIGIDQLEFSEGWAAALPFEVVLTEFQVVEVHREAVAGKHSLECILVHLQKALEHRDVRRGGIVGFEGGGQLQRSLAALDGVDEIAADLLPLGIGQPPFKEIDPRAADEGALLLVEELDALSRRVRPLIVLAGQVLHRKTGAREGHLAVIEHVHRRLGEHLAAYSLKVLRRDALHVVAVEDAHAAQASHAQVFRQIFFKRAGFHIISRSFFHVNPSNLAHSSSSAGPYSSSNA